jgi:integrase
MASVWIKPRATKGGSTRYRVEYRLTGRSGSVFYAGTFGTKREAEIRKKYVADELAARRVPDLSSLAAPKPALTIAQAAARWQASRVDVSENTRLQHRSSVRLLPVSLTAKGVDEVTAQDVADAVALLTRAGKRRGTIRHAVTVLAMTLDHAGVVPNPARNKIVVKLPREDRVEPAPPSAEHVEAVYRLLPRRHRLALLWLDWSGARVGSIDETLVSDYDEPRRRVRLRAAASKGGRGIWVELPDVLADAIEAKIGPREDRDGSARIFAPSGADALRTSIAKACKAAGIPLWSPHDLRHRRISLLHLRGMPWARIGEFVGQRDLSTTADTYTHAMIDETELDYANLLG